MTNHGGRFSSADAGRGADEQARRAAARVDRLRDQLELAERQHRAWTAGGEGERLVADAIRRACWPALHDQPWPGRPKANIDHLAVSGSRIWVVDAKHWSGDVVVRRGVLRQNGYRRSDNVTGALRAAADVSAALGPGAPPVAPLICLTRAGRNLAPTIVEGVIIVGLDQLGAALGEAPQNYEAMPELIARVKAALARPTSSAHGARPRPPSAGRPAHGSVGIPAYSPPLPRQMNSHALRYPLDQHQQVRYARWGERLAASFVDGVLLLLLTVLAAKVSTHSPSLGALTGWGWLAVAGFFAWRTGRTGRSPGKSLMRLTLVRHADGSAIGGPAGLGRGFTMLVMLIVTGGLLLGLSMLWPLWSRKNQTLHDKIVGAVVVRVFPSAK